MTTGTRKSNSDEVKEVVLLLQIVVVVVVILNNCVNISRPAVVAVEGGVEVVVVSPLVVVL